MTDLAHAIVYYYDLTPIPLVVAVFLFASGWFVPSLKRYRTELLVASLVIMGCYHVYSSLGASIFLWVEAIGVLSLAAWRRQQIPKGDAKRP